MIQINRALLTTFAAFSLAGCGTINTVFRADDITNQNLQEWNTNCASIPRVYSGVFYNLCILHSSPTNTPTQGIITANAIPLPLLDFIPSGILDTVLLPYGVYQQIARGNISIDR